MATSAITTRPAPAGIAWECGSMLLQSTQPLRKHRTLNSTAGGRAQAKAWVCSNAHSTKEVEIIFLLQEKRQTVTVREKGLLLEKINYSYWHLQEYATRTLLGFRTFSHLLGFSPTFPICWASHSIVCCRNSPRG